MVLHLSSFVFIFLHFFFFFFFFFLDLFLGCSKFFLGPNFLTIYHTIFFFFEPSRGVPLWSLFSFFFSLLFFTCSFSFFLFFFFWAKSHIPQLHLRVASMSWEPGRVGHTGGHRCQNRPFFRKGFRSKSRQNRISSLWHEERWAEITMCLRQSDSPCPLQFWLREAFPVHQQSPNVNPLDTAKRQAASEQLKSQTLTPGRNPQSQSFSRSYGSSLPTSLTFFMLWSRDS